MEVIEQLKALDRLPVHNGNGKGSAGYSGNLYINASNERRPLGINSDEMPPPTGDGKPYSGCYVNGIVDIWAQDNQHGRRINASLLGVQFVRHGSRWPMGRYQAPESPVARQLYPDCDRLFRGGTPQVAYVPFTTEVLAEMLTQFTLLHSQTRLSGLRPESLGCSSLRTSKLFQNHRLSPIRRRLRSQRSQSCRSLPCLVRRRETIFFRLVQD
jgi:hypothetical protein